MKLEKDFASRKLTINYQHQEDGEGKVKHLSLANLDEKATDDQIVQATNALISLIDGGLMGINITEVTSGDIITED